MMRGAIEQRGLSGLVAKDGQTAIANEIAQLEAARSGDHEPQKAAPFDPLMSMHWHYVNAALENGGLYLLGEGPAENDGHFCPICEFEKHSKGFSASEEIGSVADQIRKYCVAEKLILGVQ